MYFSQNSGLLCASLLKPSSPRISRSTAIDPKMSFINSLKSLLKNGNTFSSITLSSKHSSSWRKTFFRHHEPNTPLLVAVCQSWIFCFSFSLRAMHPSVILQTIHSTFHHTPSLVHACIPSPWYPQVSILYMPLVLLKRWCVQKTRSTKGHQVLQNVIQQMEFQPIYIPVLQCSLYICTNNLLNCSIPYSRSNSSFSIHPSQSYILSYPAFHRNWAHALSPGKVHASIKYIYLYILPEMKIQYPSSYSSSLPAFLAILERQTLH